ncbi:hypothetical protein DVA81_19645, partial [Acinetobacter baumannii]
IEDINATRQEDLCTTAAELWPPDCMWNRANSFIRLSPDRQLSVQGGFYLLMHLLLTRRVEKQ